MSELTEKIAREHAYMVHYDGRGLVCTRGSPIKDALDHTTHVAEVTEKAVRAALLPGRSEAEALREFADVLTAVPDYAPSEYDTGRVDQRHDDAEAALNRADLIERGGDRG